MGKMNKMSKQTLQSLAGEVASGQFGKNKLPASKPQSHGKDAMPKVNAPKVSQAESKEAIGEIFAEGDLSPEMREKDELIQELRMRIRDMLIISEQHRKILGDEISDRKRLEKEVKDLKLQMSEYMSVRVKGAGNVS